MIKRQLEAVWNQLRAKSAHYADYLVSVRLQNLRGIRDLQVQFRFPLTVLAGANASGKSTILYSCGCLYQPPSPTVHGSNAARGMRRYPSDLFPSFRSNTVAHDGLIDASGQTELEFAYRKLGRDGRMKWKQGSKGKWSKSFPGMSVGGQPARTVYIRTLSTMSNPGEVRSVLQMGRQQLTQTRLPASLLAFAHSVLPWTYHTINALESSRKDLLFAQLSDSSGGARYSEFHMSSGERAVLRLAWEIAELTDALVLIDEVDVGLHPHTQQMLMLELQRLALRQNLQFIVTTHSPVVLDAVAPEGRVFLERTEAGVVAQRVCRDLLQRAMYGQPIDRLGILAEDQIAASLVQGVMDSLGPEIGIGSGEVDIGHDSGKSEFPGHVRTLAMTGQLDDFIFVLDGDARDDQTLDLMRAAARDRVSALCVLTLPGDVPESWVWSRLMPNLTAIAADLGVKVSLLERHIQTIDQVMDRSTDRKSIVSKRKVEMLSAEIGREPTDLVRRLTHLEATSSDSALKAFRVALRDAIESWRSRLSR